MTNKVTPQELEELFGTSMPVQVIPLMTGWDAMSAEEKLKVGGGKEGVEGFRHALRELAVKQEKDFVRTKANRLKDARKRLEEFLQTAVSSTQGVHLHDAALRQLAGDIQLTLEHVAVLEQKVQA